MLYRFFSTGYNLTLERLDEAAAATDEEVEEMMPLPVAEAFIGHRRRDNFDTIREQMIGMIFTGKPYPLVRRCLQPPWFYLCLDTHLTTDYIDSESIHTVGIHSYYLRLILMNGYIYQGRGISPPHNMMLIIYFASGIKTSSPTSETNPQFPIGYSWKISRECWIPNVLTELIVKV